MNITRSPDKSSDRPMEQPGHPKAVAPKPMRNRKAMTPASLFHSFSSKGGGGGTTGDSMSARAVTAVDPKMVPRMVWGRRNFQKAFWKATTLFPADCCDEAGCEGVAGAYVKPKVRDFLFLDWGEGGFQP